MSKPAIPMSLRSHKSHTTLPSVRPLVIRRRESSTTQETASSFASSETLAIPDTTKLVKMLDAAEAGRSISPSAVTASSAHTFESSCLDAAPDSMLSSNSTPSKLSAMRHAFHPPGWRRDPDDIYPDESASNIASSSGVGTSERSVGWRRPRRHNEELDIFSRGHSSVMNSSSADSYKASPADRWHPIPILSLDDLPAHEGRAKIPSVTRLSSMESMTAPPCAPSSGSRRSRSRSKARRELPCDPNDPSVAFRSHIKPEVVESLKSSSSASNLSRSESINSFRTANSMSDSVSGSALSMPGAWSVRPKPQKRATVPPPVAGRSVPERTTSRSSSSRPSVLLNKSPSSSFSTPQVPPKSTTDIFPALEYMCAEIQRIFGVTLANPGHASSGDAAKDGLSVLRRMQSRASFKSSGIDPDMQDRVAAAMILKRLGERLEMSAKGS